MNSPLVSVILPTFNRARLLPRSMGSVLRQSCRELELIVVDDGSTDDTAEVVASIRDPRIVYVRRDANGGVAAARNAGLRVAKGQYVAFQDSDDEWLAGKLEPQVQCLREGAEASVGMIVRMIDQTARCWPPCSGGDRTDPPAWLLHDGVGYCQTLVSPRSLIEAAGGFDERLTMWEDWDLLLRLAQRVRMVRCSESWVVSPRGDDSLTNDRSRFAAAQGSAVDKHAEWLSTMPRAYARLQYIVGRLALEHRATGEAIRRFARSLSLNPWDAKAWAFMLRALGSALLTGPRP